MSRRTNVVSIGEGLRFEALCGGRAVQRVNDQLRELIENIANPLMPAEAKRKLVITVSVLPNKERSRATLDVETALKLQAPVPVGTNLRLEDGPDGLQAIEQMDLPLEGSAGQ